MGKNTSISLGEHFEGFIQNKMNTGRYNSASEIIRTALRLLESEENKANELRQLLELGENSKIRDDFDPVAKLHDLHSRYL